MNKNLRNALISLVILLVLLLSACSGGAEGGSVDMPAPPENAQEGIPADVSTESAPAESAAAETATPTAEAQSTLEATATQEAELKISAVLEVGSKTFNKTHEDITADEDNQSAALVTNGGTLTIGYADITKSGDSTSTDNSSLFGQNAATLGNEESTLRVLYSTVTTSGKGATGVYARGELTNGTVLDSTIATSGGYAHAVQAAIGASMKVTNTEMTTAGDHSSAIATDHGYATITVEDSSAATSGMDSPGVEAGYGGEITLNNTKISASASSAAAIEGAGSIDVTDSPLSTSADDQAVVNFYQEESNDDSDGEFSMSGGSLTNTGSNGAIFYATNSSGSVELEDVAVEAKSGVLIQAEAGDWGEKGSNGGELTFAADDVNLTGDVRADEASLVDIELENGSVLKGAINPENTADVIRLTLDASSSWNVTADSYLTKLNDEEGISDTSITNITGNGFTVYYNSNSNVYLKGKIYTLSGGGYLKPLN